MYFHKGSSEEQKEVFMKIFNVRKVTSGWSISRILSGDSHPLGDHLSVQPT